MTRMLTSGVASLCAIPGELAGTLAHLRWAAQQAAQPTQRPGLATGRAAFGSGLGPALAGAVGSIGHGSGLQRGRPAAGAPTGSIGCNRPVLIPRNPGLADPELQELARTSASVVTPASTLSMPSWRSVRMPSHRAWCCSCAARLPVWIISRSSRDTTISSWMPARPR